MDELVLAICRQMQTQRVVLGIETGSGSLGHLCCFMFWLASPEVGWIDA